MATVDFEITIHMVSSLDGMIARKDNSVSWFETTDHYDKGVSEQNVEEFLKSIDCYIMGARTYEHALELATSYGWAYGDKPIIVFTHRKLPVDRKNIELFSGDLNSLVNERIKPRFRHVWIVGGPSLVRDFILSKLADEIRITILPILLGDGLPFFDRTTQELALHLKDVTAYQNGMVELRYEIKK